ncbi:MAG TPA: alginate lyase family protein, partial [bacterium]|nr:alginate lyase family protein [bacterium]
MLYALMLLGCMVATVSEESMSAHPHLFITIQDVARARQSIRTDPQLAEHAQDLLRVAREKSQENLPKLETEWWKDSQSKPWSQTYPEINYHTGKVPREWAELAWLNARASLLFPDQDLQERAMQVLLGLSEYTFDFEHYDVGMNYATWGWKCLDVYDILYDRFTPDQRTELDGFFERMVQAIIKNDEFWIEKMPGGRLNNHYAWHKLARVMYGLHTNQWEMVQEALWGSKGIIDSLRYGFTDDGLWLESSLNYQLAQTSPMVMIAKLLENTDSPFSLWNYQTDDGRTLKQAYDALIEIVFPDQTLPNIGDCYGSRVRLGRVVDFETLYSALGDARYPWLINQIGRRSRETLFCGVAELPEGEPPILQSRLWPEHGYAMLRSRHAVDYWTGLGWTVFATYAYASVHNNADKLSIQLFANNHHWLVDREAKTGVHHAFSSAVQTELNRSTHCHNTLLVDGSYQNGAARLDLIEFSSLPELKRLSIGDIKGRLYPGVQQLRTILVMEEYVLDVFQAISDGTHNFDWLLHIDGQSVTSSEQSWKGDPFPETPPWKWLRNPECSDSLSCYREVFTNGKDSFSIDIATDRTAKMIRCGFPQTDHIESETWPMRMLHCT